MYWVSRMSFFPNRRNRAPRSGFLGERDIGPPYSGDIRPLIRANPFPPKNSVRPPWKLHPESTRGGKRSLIEHGHANRKRYYRPDSFAMRILPP